MIKLLIAIVLTGLLTDTISAQTSSDPAKADTKTTPVMKAPARTQVIIKTAPATETPKTTTAPGPKSSDFSLTSAKATIYTGNDNKEQPSQVQMQIMIGEEGVGNYMVPTSQYKEFPVNSAIELPFQFYYDRNYYNWKLWLTNVETAGAKIFINYSPNFLLDAWKIEKVVLTLEFRDGNGNLHPTLGTKNIVFTNIGALLNENNRTLVCEADQFLMPTKAYVRK